MDETLPTAGAVPPRERLARGTAIGRYVLLAPIGSGGVGQVYAAFDPQLDRKVAIKLVRPETSAALDLTESRARMQREAQAMARLSHPNVVAVHDVGTFEQDVFVAMELIDGQTLKQWLAAAPHSWRDIRDIFVQAARGLAAAHAAGMVHRDFKPENVMIGPDGRARVLDFGLARASVADDPPAAARALADTALGSPSPFGADITRTGTLLGTPAYMSPEQHMHQRTDARSDQFSFCVALYEGLYGERPFSGDTIGALGLAVMQGKIAGPPKGTKVPAWLRAVILRGLSVDPEARFSSMDSLVVALLSDPAARRRKLVVATAALGAIVAAAGAGYKLSRPHEVVRSPYGYPSEPQNMDFEEGEIGNPPTDWGVAGDSALYPVDVVADGCLHGQRCARIRIVGKRMRDEFGNVMQTLDASTYRGKKVRFRVSTRVEGGALAFPWLRVDRPGRRLGYFYNWMYDPPVTTESWATRDIVGQIADDATELNYGVMHFGLGRVFVDAAALDVVPDTTPVTIQPSLPAPTNLDFEAGLPGQPAPGWRMLADDPLRALTSSDSPHGGARCLAVKGAGEMAAAGQRIDAHAWRGKHLHVSAAVRGESVARVLAVRVDVGFQERIVNERDLAPAPGTAWRIHDVDLLVPDDADVIEISLFADEMTTIYVDDVTVDVR